MKIRTKLILTLSTLTALLILVGWGALDRLYALRLQVNGFYHHPYTVANHAHRFIEEMHHLQEQLQTLATTSGPHQSQQLIQKIEQAVVRQQQNVAIIQTRYLGSRVDAAKLKEEFHRWQQIKNDVIALVMAQNSKAASLLVEQSAGPQTYKLHTIASQILKFASERAQRFLQESLKLEKSSFYIIATVVALAVLIALAMLGWILWSVFRPLQNLMQFVRSFEQGNYQARLPFVRNDELGYLSITLNEMANKVEQYAQNLEVRVQERTQDLLAANQQLRASEQQLRATEQQLLASNQQLKASNQQLAEREIILSAQGDRVSEMNRELSWKVASLKCISDFQEISEQEEQIERSLLRAVMLIPSYFVSGIQVAVKVQFEQSTYFSEQLVQTSSNHVSKLWIDEREVGTVQFSFASTPGSQVIEIEPSIMTLVNLISARLNDLVVRVHGKIERVQLMRNLFLTSKLASIGELAAGVGHEINNPLAIILGQVEMLDQVVCDQNRPAGCTRALTALTKSVYRIKNIVDGLRIYASGMRQQEVVRIDFHQAIRESLQFVEEIFQKEMVQLEVDLLAEHTEVLGNRGHIQQVLVNFLTNARDAFEGRGGLVKISTRQEGHNLVVVVRDNGKGIGPKDMDRIFDPFFTTKEVGQGTGLGLGIARAIIQEMQGKIEVQSVVNVGTSFTIHLPLALEQSLSGPDVKTAVEEVTSREKKFEGDILIVDDEHYICEQLHLYLTHLGFSVDMAYNGLEAVEKLEQKQYVCVLTDIKMPVMDGVELIRLMVAQQRQEKIIIITGGIVGELSDFEKQFSLLSHKPLGFLRKPFSRKEVEEEMACHFQEAVVTLA